MTTKTDSMICVHFRWDLHKSHILNSKTGLSTYCNLTRSSYSSVGNTELDKWMYLKLYPFRSGTSNLVFSR